LRISELERRDPVFWVRTRNSLAGGWSAQFGREVRVFPRIGEGQVWGVQRWLSACFQGVPSYEVRGFLADLFRYTSRPARAPFQYAAGTVLATRVSFRLSRCAFRVDPPIPHAGNLLVIPGNRRIRVFDFRTRRCRVFASRDSGRSANLREASVRCDVHNDALVPVLGHAADGSWLEEPLEAVSPLPRLRPWQSPREVEERALEALGAHLLSSTRAVDGREHANALAAASRDCVRRLTKQAGDFPSGRLLSLVDRLVERAGSVGPITLARGHGDFQPGNVLARPDGRVLLIDWEYADERWVWYDFVVFLLGARSPRGLAGRTRAAGLGQVAKRAPACLRDLHAELCAPGSLALFLLEELVWSLNDEVDVALAATSDRLRLVLAEVEALLIE